MKYYNSTILIVEDDADDQVLIEAAFRSAGISTPIHIASDGAEAIDYMCGEGKYGNREQYPYPTFIIMDLKMPREDGFGVLEFLKKNPEWRIVPTVVLSSSRDLDDIKKSYMLGASSYHVKPQSMEELKHQLKVLHDYWATCEVPQVDKSGKQLPTESQGKLGVRFAQPHTREKAPHR